jgi:hypothetical protein
MAERLVQALWGEQRAAQTRAAQLSALLGKR